MGKRSFRIIEEHDPVARHQKIGNKIRLGPERGVGLGKAQACQFLPFPRLRPLPGHRDEITGQIDPQNLCARAPLGKRQGQFACATAQIEHPRPLFAPDGLQQGRGQPRKREVGALPFLRPGTANAALPIRCLGHGPSSRPPHPRSSQSSWTGCGRFANSGCKEKL